jgi:hypothetical protein
VYAIGSTLFVVMITLTGVMRIVRRAVPPGEMEELEVLARRNPESMDSVALTGSVWRFVESVRLEPTLSLRMDLIAERLSEVDLDTTAVAARVGMWARVALYFGAGATVASVGRHLGRPLGIESLGVFGPFLLGAGMASTCLWLGRWANARAGQRRWAWDRLSATRLRPLLAEQIPAHRPRT